MAHAGLLDHTIHAPLLSALGIIDAVALLGGGLVVGQWATGTRARHIRLPRWEAADEKRADDETIATIG